MTTKHTHGPWQTDGQYLVSGAVRLAVLESADDNAGLDYDEAEANANLIAAAPDLLAALKKALRVYGVDMQPAHRDEFRAAIAKAHG